MKNSFSLGVAFATSASVSADWAPESAEATETSVEKPELERAGHWPALGFFDLKEHFAAIGFALLPAYWVCWRRPRADEPAQTRMMLTSILAFVIWWGFLTGHVVNNIRGFGA